MATKVSWLRQAQRIPPPKLPLLFQGEGSCPKTTAAAPKRYSSCSKTLQQLLQNATAAVPNRYSCCLKMLRRVVPRPYVEGAQPSQRCRLHRGIHPLHTSYISLTSGSGPPVSRTIWGIAVRLARGCVQILHDHKGNALFSHTEEWSVSMGI
jgi:hypothetical protein